MFAPIGYSASIFWYLLTMPKITVTQTGSDLFTVNVSDERGITVHKVRLSALDQRRLAPEADPARLVEESFRFLLEREPKEAILRTFDLPVIGRYFPEYDEEIKSRIG
jgi:hypothetical protein